MDNPFAAVVQTLSRRDSTSLLIALFFSYALVAFGLATAADGGLRWLINATGAVSFATGIAAFAYTYWFKPERLRAPRRRTEWT